MKKVPTLDWIGKQAVVKQIFRLVRRSTENCISVGCMAK